jgi:hypothetical protein
MVSVSYATNAIKTNAPQYVVSVRCGQFHCEACSVNCSVIQSLLTNAVYIRDVKGTET